jgi:hypothetical protein
VSLATAQENPCRSQNLATTGNEDDGENSGGIDQDPGSSCVNEGDSEGEVQQDGSASSGDGVAGQVAGVVSAGDASVDATNRSDDVEVDTGNATGTNTADLRVRGGVGFGESDPENPCRQENEAHTGNETDSDDSGGITQSPADVCANTGDVEGEVSQAADAASGDGVGGQVIGVVTSAGGSADLVLDNESTDAEVESGEGDFTNDTNTFVEGGVSFGIGP